MKEKLISALKALGERGIFRIVSLSLGIGTIHKNGCYYGIFDFNKNTFVD